MMHAAILALCLLTASLAGCVDASLSNDDLEATAAGLQRAADAMARAANATSDAANRTSAPPEAPADPDVDEPAFAEESLWVPYRDRVKRYEPHVLVAVPDTGINPYHHTFLRPERTEHPCTYIKDFPCHVRALNLTVGGDDYEAAYSADANRWAAVKPGVWYWIPRTVFVAVSCELDTPSICILDDNHMHGTGTTSSVLSENPDALIAFKEGGPDADAFFDAGLPVDIVSVSWGWVVPQPSGQISRDWVRRDVVYVVAAGNDPRSTLLDSWSGHPYAISVGGAYAQDDSEEIIAAKHTDVVSYFCRPTAQTRATTQERASYCGTSFAAPTVAGGLSKVVLALRRASGHLGGIDHGYVDPERRVAIRDLRDAMNLTASYAPEPRYDNTWVVGVPLNPIAPWLQWGWGFYDGGVADATIAHLLGGTLASKPPAAVDHMQNMHDAKKTRRGLLG